MKERTLRSTLSLTFDDLPDLHAIARAFVALQTCEPFLKKLGFTGWRLDNVAVVKPQRRRRT